MINRQHSLVEHLTSISEISPCCPAVTLCSRTRLFLHTQVCSCRWQEYDRNLMEAWLLRLPQQPCRVFIRWEVGDTVRTQACSLTDGKQKLAFLMVTGKHEFVYLVKRRLGIETWKGHVQSHTSWAQGLCRDIWRLQHTTDGSVLTNEWEKASTNQWHIKDIECIWHRCDFPLIFRQQASFMLRWYLTLPGPPTRHVLLLLELLFQFFWLILSCRNFPFITKKKKKKTPETCATFTR